MSSRLGPWLLSYEDWHDMLPCPELPPRFVALPLDDASKLIEDIFAHVWAYDPQMRACIRECGRRTLAAEQYWHARAAVAWRGWPSHIVPSTLEHVCNTAGQECPECGIWVLWDCDDGQVDRLTLAAFTHDFLVLLDYSAFFHRPPLGELDVNTVSALGERQRIAPLPPAEGAENVPPARRRRTE
ncbi:hypothetical protein FA09DRAFT_326788 [Tilletiopsis washingtonensis]|uniref:Uncharacterized protein n=1 Tax=Tilletiopsis washingtonensis TaxID=58919 RepID=A0A316Z005_9BASI|nr:hypothetical protein FA09DRAFT_326788 [Tilletiopsis washingtonensis]PWN95040.1 hypothetical protein FA09DRAFT_326788 [Tilletiopsis washingtonensis]